jgi:hypothetical protein
LFRRSRGRALLVVVQIGLAVVLLLSSGLLIRSFLKLSSVDPGYATTRVLTFQVPLSPNQSALRFSADLLARIKGLPGVRAAGYADHLPLTRSESRARDPQYAFGAEPVHRPPPPPPPGINGRPDFPVVHFVSRASWPRWASPLSRGAASPTRIRSAVRTASSSTERWRGVDSWASARSEHVSTPTTSLGRHRDCRGCPRDRPGRPSRP